MVGPMYSLGTVELLIQKNFLNGRKRNSWRIMTWGNGEKVIQKMNQVRDSVVVLQDPAEHF